MSPPFAADLEPEAAEPDTPRRALERFLLAYHKGRYAEAARELPLFPEQQPRGEELARRLGEVLDSRFGTETDWLAKVSDNPVGDSKDGMPSEKEEIGRIRGRYFSQGVRMRRVPQPSGEPRWMFTYGTIARIDGWYLSLEDLWLREHLPRRFLLPGPRGFLLWEWVALPVLLVASSILATLITMLASWSLLPLVRRTKARWDELFVDSLRKPLRLVIASAILGWAMRYLLISPSAEQFVHKLARVGVLLGLFFTAWKIVDVVVKLVRTSTWLRQHPAALGVIPLGYRLAEVTVLAVALVFVLQEFGYPVTSIVAGLGIGGLAVALAAQKTVEHVLGGVMLSIDQPLRVGDLVRIGDTEGWVDHIGLRSTRIRTLDRSILTIPNGKLADMAIESLASRDHMRVHLVLGVTFDLTAERVDSLRNAVLAFLKSHPKLWPGQLLRVHFAGFGESSLNIDISAWFEENDVDRFLELRHQVLVDKLRRPPKALLFSRAYPSVGWCT